MAIKNTFIILVCSILLNIVLGSTFAYALARFNFKFKGVILLLMMGARVIPTITTQVATFTIISKLGLYNTLGAPILLYAGAVPIKTDKGWLEIYHTVSQTCNGFIYRLKAALLSLDDPGEVIGYTKDFLLWPEHDYEMKGRVMNVVFTCSALPSEDGTLRIYYGAADTNIGLATGNIDEIVAACLENT